MITTTTINHHASSIPYCKLIFIVLTLLVLSGISLDYAMIYSTEVKPNSIESIGKVQLKVNQIDKFLSGDASMQLALEFDTSSDIANYTWENSTSNRWIPPQNLPHLRRSDMMQIYTKENTLWLGDSTGRQDYHTLYWLLHETNLSSDHHDMSSLDFIEADQQHKHILEKYKNMNKECWNNQKYPIWCPARRIEKQHKMYLLNVGQVGGHSDKNHCFQNKTTPQKRISSIGKLDYVTAKTKCFPSILADLVKHKYLLEHYSVIVFSVGVFVSVHGEDCQKESPGRTLQQRIYDLLDFLRDEIASPERTIIWKIHGPSTSPRLDTLVDQEIVRASRNWFDNNTVGATGMELSDFRYAIRERSYGKKRIAGDSNEHWGLRARLLSLDLVTRIIAKTS